MPTPLSSPLFPATALLVAGVCLLLFWVYASPTVFSHVGWTLVLLAVVGALVAGSANGYAEPRALIAALTALALGYGIHQAAGAAGGLLAEYIGLVLGALAVLVLLAVGWLLFAAQLQRQTGPLGLLVQLLFALPCYLAWLAQYLAADFQSTAPATLILLAAQMTLLTAYLFRKRIAAAAEWAAARVHSGGGLRSRFLTTPLQTERVFLNHETRLGNRPLPEGAGAMNMLTSAPSLGQNQDYRLSLELYLHALEIGADAKPILRYANGCPSILFEGAGVPRTPAVDNLRNEPQLQIHLTNATNDDGTRKEPPFRIAVHLQRWVRLVFYYTRTQVDVFMDDKLVHSLAWTHDNRPTFQVGDQFVLGSPMPHGGALGSLRNLSVDTPRPRGGVAGSADAPEKSPGRGGFW